MAQENSNQDNYIRPPGRPPLSFSPWLRDAVFRVAWRIGSCQVAMGLQPAPPACSPLLKGMQGCGVGR